MISESGAARMTTPGPIGSIVFDIGETIRDDTGEFREWAAWLGIPPHTLSAVIGAVRAQGGSTNDAFRYFRDNFDIEEQRRLRTAVGSDEQMGEPDLYPDVRTSLRALHELGVWICLAGNQSARCGSLLRDLDLPVDAIFVSADFGADKPDRDYFEFLLARIPYPAAHVLHVGDNWQNDVISASLAGMQTAFLRRGPWGYLHADEPSIGSAPSYRINQLPDLIDIVRNSNGIGGRLHGLPRGARQSSHGMDGKNPQGERLAADTFRRSYHFSR
jgi:HAD superfamily hydrolase (TIGR01549 family)